MSDFYVDTLNRLLRKDLLRRDMKVLVVCAGRYDQEVLQQCGFTNVTMSNLDTRVRGDEFAPYGWSFQDAEELDFDDGQFDVAIAHSGLHHCRSPHRALLEMYRVARQGAIVFEPSDNVVTRFGVRLGLGQEYELAAVAGNDCRFGGQKNTPIPNYVYRWTEREVEKTVSSYAPFGAHEFLYFYKLRMPWYRSRMMTHRLLDAAYLLLSPLARCLTWVFPRWSNNFAFMVLKPGCQDDLHPWLTAEGGTIALNAAWVRRRYGAAPDAARQETQTTLQETDTTIVSTRP
ncbi:MAG: class I SAM-dependent methyltransferase [Pirellulales bacterium]|nr:class I SAM-dependent methyltransferase [Pirellulales bacterium]